MKAKGTLLLTILVWVGLPLPVRVEATPRQAVRPGSGQIGIETFFNESYTSLLLRYPEAVTGMGLPGLHAQVSDRLDDHSLNYLRQTQELEREILLRLRSFDHGVLTAAQRLSADVYDWYLDDLVAGQPFADNDYPLNPTPFSVNAQVLQLFMYHHPIAKLQDARDYVRRLSRIKPKFDQLIEGLQRRERTGIVLPFFLIRPLIAELKSIADVRADQTPFYGVLAARLKEHCPTDQPDDRQILAEAESEIDASVIPAYRMLIRFLEGQLRFADNRAGIWKQTRGKAAYAHLLRHYTTTELSAEQMHELGKRELERIHADMCQRFAALGYPARRSLPSLFVRLERDSGSLTGAEALATYERIIERADQSMAALFGHRPRSGLIVVGSRSGSSYLPPSMDGLRPGVFLAYNQGAVPRFSMASLAYHEAVPGHHYQLAVSQELDLPLMRRDMGFGAHVEGWALYAERLAWEQGLYSGDAYGDLGRLQYEAYRAARLVVDTGLHAKRWSFAQAVDFMVKNTGMSRGGMQSEVVRYICVPGQATAYFIGFLKILDLRERARTALGACFDLREFHDILLGNGALPLPVLERLVDAYIEKRKNGPG